MWSAAEHLSGAADGWLFITLLCFEKGSTTLELIKSYNWGEIKDKKKREALIVYMQLAFDKCLCYNSISSTFDSTRSGSVRNIFSRHDFSFTWSYGEIDGFGQLFRFGYEQIIDS